MFSTCRRTTSDVIPNATITNGHKFTNSQSGLIMISVIIDSGNEMAPSMEPSETYFQIKMHIQHTKSDRIPQNV